MLALTDVVLDPLTLCVDDLLPYVPVTVPYSNHAVVDNPLGLTVPFSVAELDVIFVAEPVVTVGGCVFVALYVTVIVSVPEFPEPSVAVTVMTFSPLERLMPDIVQLVVPLAVPLPPLLLLHLTLLILPELSDAVPLRVMALLVVVYVEPDVGLVMVTVGAVVSEVDGVGVGVGVAAELVVNDASLPYDVPALFCAAMR